MPSTPPPLPLRQLQSRQAKPRVSGCAVIAGILISGVVLFFVVIGVVGYFFAKSVQSAAPAARERLAERFENARAKNSVEEIKLPAIIPGLSAREIKEGLMERGFKLSTTNGKTQTKFDLSDTDYTKNRSVAVHGPTAKPDAVHAVSVLARTEDAKAFLGALAMIPIRGVNAQEASAWVKDNIGHKTARAWWGVKFQLHYNEKTDFHSLRISMDPLNDGDFPPLPKPAEPPPPESAVTEASAEPNPAPVISEPKPPTPPRIGQTFAEVVADYGEPSIKDSSTGWAWWKDFKVKFINAKAVEIESQ